MICKVRVIFKTLVLLTLLLPQSQAQNSITAIEARNHVGEKTTVCGQVASIHFAARSRGTPTFINLDKAYPDQVFTVLIWGNDRPKFGTPEQNYRGKSICVTGKISEYRGVPEIVAYEPSQIKITSSRE